MELNITNAYLIFGLIHGLITHIASKRARKKNIEYWVGIYLSSVLMWPALLIVKGSLTWTYLVKGSP